MISFKKYYQQQLTEDNILNIENLLLDLTDFDQESMKKDPTLTKWLRREVKKYVANTEFLNFPTVDQYLKDAPRANITDWYKTVPDGKLYVYNYACEDEMYKELKRKINIARDFYQSWTSLEKSKIIKMTLDHVIELYEEMKKQKLVEGKDFVVVMVFADEHKWVKLLTPLAFEIQGQKASNCLSSSWISCAKDKSEFKKDTIQGVYSLYKNTKPKVTLSVSKDKEINEIAFFSNKYRFYTLEFIKKYKLVPIVYSSLADIGLTDWPPYEQYLDQIGFDRNSKD